MTKHFKDSILDRLAEQENVAQFVSFSPNLQQRYSRIAGKPANHRFIDSKEAIAELFNRSPEGLVNVRSFLPDQPQSHEFIYGISNLPEAFSHVERLTSKGLYVIINETIDVNDGGVSGVLQNDVVEFAPGVVPRFVEKSKDPVSTLPREFAVQLLKLVYGVDPHLDYPSNFRVEFSLHPQRRGWRQTNTIIWEEEKIEDRLIEPFYKWPTAFSKLIGDKAYGLIVSHLLGFLVPKTTVFSRDPRIGIFSFGTPTGSHELWIRTCPIVQQPGLYTTIRGWKDPYVIMANDDPDATFIASCLAQQEVSAHFSGALITTKKDVIIEGVKGFGKDFMAGRSEPISLPKEIFDDVQKLYGRIKSLLGAVRIEWAHDGRDVWILQLHVGESESSSRIIYPGTPTKTVIFNVSEGLPTLRSLISSLEPDTGIYVIGNIGMSSHIADVLRKAKIPSQIVG